MKVVRGIWTMLLGSAVGLAIGRSRRLIAAILIVVPLTAHAWGGYTQVTVSVLTVYQSGQGASPGVLIQIIPTPTGDNEGCAQSGHGYAWIDFSSTGQPDGKALYAMALAAQMSGKPLGIGLNGCSSLGYPMVYGLNSYP